MIRSQHGAIALRTIVVKPAPETRPSAATSPAASAASSAPRACPSTWGTSRSPAWAEPVQVPRRPSSRGTWTPPSDL